MTIHEKLLAVQSELKAPKGQLNKFGGYHYRSCEDILEALKPLLKAHGLVLSLSDSIEMIGNRFYVKATATVSMPGDPVLVASVTAYAREEEVKKGMDGSQITGAASSYARKYALNGLFLIDDTEDADTQDNRPTQTETKPKANVASPSKTPTKPTITFVMESFNKSKDLASLDTIYKRANEYTWTEQDRKDIAECYANVAKRLQSASV